MDNNDIDNIKLNDCKVGRPTKFNQEIADKICELISTTSIGIKRLSKMYDFMPNESTIYLWLIKHESFSKQYNIAKKFQGEILAQECLEICDDNENDYRKNEKGELIINAQSVSRDRLRIDTRKWMAARLLPRIYGDNIKLEEEIEKNDILRAELIELRNKLDMDNKKDY